MARMHDAPHNRENAAGHDQPHITGSRLSSSARRRTSLLLGAVLGGALALAGCASDGEIGAPGTGVAAAGSVGGVNDTAPGAGMTVGTGPDAVTFECPSVTVRSGASNMRVTDSQGRLRYQANIGQLARECTIVGSEMTAKIGIEGRVLLGEAGSPGTFNVPIRVAVVEEGPAPRTVITKVFNVPVTIASGESQAPFTVVEDQISFPLKATPKDMERYVFYVGYDPKGQTAAPKPRRTSTSSSSTPRPARPAATSTPAPVSSAPAATTPSVTRPAPTSTELSTPPSDVFGPPPASSTATGGFAPPPSSSAFEPPPAASTN